MVRSSALKKVIQIIRLAWLAHDQNLNPDSVLEEGKSIKRGGANPKSRPETSSRRDMVKAVAGSMVALPFSGGFLNQAIAAEFGNLIPLQPTSRRSNEPIVIIGAGTAGLVAAHRLNQAGLSCAIYEASARVGGRMFTQRDFNLDGMFCELGGELVDKNHSDLISMCGELGVGLENLRTGDQNVKSDLFFIDGRTITSQQMLLAYQPLAVQIAADLKKMFGTADVNVPTYKDKNNPTIVKYDQLSLEEYLYSKQNVEKWALDLLNVLYLCEYGLETGEQSALNFLTLISTDTSSDLKLLGESDESQRIVGGSSALPDALAMKLEGKVPTYLGHQLVRIQDTWRGLKLVFMQGSKSVEVFAKQVICAIPFSVLRNVEGIKSLGLRPNVRDCIFKFGYGTNSKFMMGFKKRIWRDPLGASSNGSLLTVAQQQFWETSRAQPGTSGILTNFLGGRMGKEIPRGQCDENLRILDRVFPGAQEQYDRNSVLQHWPSFPWAMGSYTCLKPGQYTSLHGLAAESALSDRLFFAGEHTSVDFSGFMNGAVQSGNRVSKAILDRLNVQQPAVVAAL